MKNCRPGILFCDGCVLQRQKPVTIWGEGKDGETVTVKLAEAEASCRVEDGKWKCVLPAMEAASGLTLSISCGDEKEVLEDVSVGEVWIAGGQSNMEYFLRYDAQWEETQELERNDQIHMFNVPRLAYAGQPKDISDSGYWFREGDKAWETFSAPGYSFARSIQPVLGVPVGIIGCNWGGSSAATWMDESYMEEEPIRVYLRDYEEAVAGRDLDELKAMARRAYEVEDSPENGAAWAGVMYGINREEQEAWMKNAQENPGPENPMGPYNINRPGRLYHRMLTEIIPCSARGVLWYQGETDECHAQIYDKLFAAMIRCFREQFGQELPFLFVQLAPYGTWLGGNGIQYPELRYRQELVSRTVPGTYMTSIMDLGMYEDIHPKHKMEVGERLALLARGKIYGEDILCEPAECVEAVREDNRIILRFDKTGSGLWEVEPIPEDDPEAEKPSVLTGPEQMKEGFLLSQNGEYVPINEVCVLEDEIVLWADSLAPGECRVDFAQVPYIRVRIYNEAELPLKPFTRTV